MSTTKIMLIRHAEKPNGEPGVMPDGSQSGDALTATRMGARQKAALGYLIMIFETRPGR